MSTHSAISSTRSIVDWNADRTNVFIDVCPENTASRPNRVGHWYDQIAAAFNQRTGLEYNVSHMKNKSDNMKREWSHWNKLLQISGGYWNEALDTVVGSDEWWATVPSACRRFKTQSPACFRALDEIFDGCIRTDKCQYIVPPQPPVGLAFEAQIIGDYLRGNTEGISSCRGSQHHDSGTSGTSEYYHIIAACMQVKEEYDDYQKWEVAICVSHCAEKRQNPLIALLHRPVQLRLTIIHYVDKFRCEIF